VTSITCVRGAFAALSTWTTARRLRVGPTCSITGNPTGKLMAARVQSPKGPLFFLARVHILVRLATHRRRRLAQMFRGPTASKDGLHFLILTTVCAWTGPTWMCFQQSPPPGQPVRPWQTRLLRQVIWLTSMTAVGRSCLWEVSFCKSCTTSYVPATDVISICLHVCLSSIGLSKYSYMYLFISLDAFNASLLYCPLCPLVVCNECLALVHDHVPTSHL
jgi:hypothetical protein